MNISEFCPSNIFINAEFAYIEFELLNRWETLILYKMQNIFMLKQDSYLYSSLTHLDNTFYSSKEEVISAVQSAIDKINKLKVFL